MDGEHGGGGDPFEIPGLAGKMIARAGYTEFKPEIDKSPEERTKKVRNVRMDLVGGDVVHLTSLEDIHVGIQGIRLYQWLANIPGLPIPDDTLAIAAGLSAGDPELSWERIAAVLKTLGLGAHDPDALVRAVDVWLMQKGTSRARVSAAVREARRG